MSEEITEVTPEGIDAKLARIALQFGRFGFDGTNDFSKYKYTSAAQIVEAVRKPLFEEGISVAAQSRVENSEWTPKQSHLVIVSVTLCLTCNGESRVFSGVGSGADKGDKAVMKATTAALKYALATGFLLSWGVTDDPEADESTDKDHGSKRSPRKNHKPAGNKRAYEDVMSDITSGVEVAKTEVLAFREHPEYTELVAAHKAANKKEDK